ncbi:DUF1579 domain-containing protein [Flavobacterium macacae]|uniref:DUF1579 domain-containing protein n=1 Tax=Flavobacterium macacae TaxID=2488993 RepID=A0A3P3W303_9FLAO|nr:DUF1579 domain-containing protein [Flavobacterium macacae]RRJ89471.1 DUF1579 domain-containing protein [Flavobacterium macacae]
MKTAYLYLGALLLCMTSCKKEVTIKEEVINKVDTVPELKEAEITSEPIDSLAMQKAWTEYATPTEPHKRMASESGTWTEDLTFWMSPEDKNPQKYTAVAQVKMILGGRYQEQKHTGRMMGMDFEGISTLAYNNASGEYTSTWVDNMGTGMMIASGKYDEASKSTTFNGEMVDPMTKKIKEFRQVVTIIDNDTQKMESFENAPDGTEFKSMEIMMKRKK